MAELNDAGRGFAMRHGRKSKLLKPKSGRAALRAEIMGQGQEVMRGRSSFARSVNRVHRHYCFYYNKDSRLYQSRSQAEMEIRDAFEDMRDRSDQIDEFWWLDVEEPAEEEWSEDWDVWWSAPKTQAVRDDKEPEDPLKRKLLELQGSLHVQSQVKLHIDALQDTDAFTKLQRDFIFAHGAEVCKSLHSVYRHLQCLHLVPAKTSQHVQERFLDVLRQGTVMGKLTPAFHGTAEKNISPILQNGLLIPGQGNQLRVANGSAHGLGIYTGKASALGADLSYGFARGGPMLVCGVLDDAAVLASQYTLGLRSVSAESANVRHVGNAMVVFDNRRVVPLFVAGPNSRFATAKVVVVSFNWAKRDRLLERLRCEYGDNTYSWSKPPLRHQPRQQQVTARRDPVKFLARRAARKRQN